MNMNAALIKHFFSSSMAKEKTFLFSGMKKKALFVIVCSLSFVACKKNNSMPPYHNSQLFPLTSGNEWVYADSFFDVTGTYSGLDTFHLKSAATLVHNNHIYTPITDQFDEAVFTVRSDDSSVFVWKPAGEALMFSLPLPATVPYMNNSYSGDTLNSKIYTDKIKTIGYPSYRIVIKQDDGLWYHYVQDEYFFSIGIGIIKGNTKWKNNNGDVYTSDSYTLTYYYVK